jgi:membrane protein YqaA with SNARE-associated domain
MRIFSALYTRAMRWAAHPHARYYLGGLSFAESSFFPVPPDVMLAPMTLAKPADAWRLAALTTLTSVLGGLLGYGIGMFAFELVEPLIRSAGYWEGYIEVHAWFERWGFWAVFVAGFSPVPYKLFTIGAGVIAMPLLPFMLASLISRGARFFLVAGLVRAGGARMEYLLRTYVDAIGYLMIVVVIVAYFVFGE